MITSFPLEWPPGWPRTDRPQTSQFKVSQHEAQSGLMNELQLLGAHDVVLSTNVELRRDGLPYASRRPPEDQGVAVYFKYNSEQQCIPCDKWRTIRENMQAIRKTVEALRGLDRWGAKEMVNAAFRGFKALPSPSSATPDPSARTWYEILQVQPNATPQVVRAAYKQAVLRTHPDTSGSIDAFQEVQRAYKESGAAA